MSDVTLIFTHYGYSSYLDYTLACLRKTNPDARLVLLGDEDNADVARRNDWEHRLLFEAPGDLQARFGRVFRHVQGVKHDPIRNGRDWLRYVFERWFFIEGFVRQESIDRFWHFDSDTMVLQDLGPHGDALDGIDFSVQCNGTCLNGIMNSVVVAEFCDHICKLFEDAEFLASQQREFDSVHPEYAFTEMRAFDNYKTRTSRPWLHLLEYRSDKVFDDCICQEQGFQMTTLPSGERVKQIFSGNGKVYGVRGGREVEFISLNLSWVPDYVFRWALNALDGRSSEVEHAPCSFWDSMRGMARKTTKFARNVIVSA